jgi:pimeloyl-ACP methyl ester carboxylesterase
VPEVRARGIRFHVQECEGDGPVVVFVHGLVIDNLASFYYTLAPAVAEAGAHCVLYDLRGHGRTERTPSGYTVRDSVADLFAVLDALGHHRAFLVANSYGGVIALNAALLRPGRVDGLALIEAHGPSDRLLWHEGLLNTLTKSALSLEYERTAERLLATGMRRLGRVAAHADALLNRTTLLDDIAAAGPVRPAALAGLDLPVLAVYGQHSDVADAGRLLLRNVPGCTLHTMAGYAHTVLQEGTAEILEVLLPWLAHHAGTRTPAASLAGGDRR